MGSTRIKGTALSMLLDGVDYWADAVSVVLDGDDQELGGPTLCGTNSTRIVRVRSWFDVEAIQSTQYGSFWRFLDDNRGRALPYAYAPHGNPIPTSDEPHFTGILVLPDVPPVLGGSAGRTVEQTFTTRLHIAQGPYRVTTT